MAPGFATLLVPALRPACSADRACAMSACGSAEPSARGREGGADQQHAVSLYSRGRG